MCHPFQVVLKLPEHLCVFPMLTHLEVGFLSVDILLALLRKTPVLKTLVLKVRSYYYGFLIFTYKLHIVFYLTFLLTEHLILNSFDD